MKLSIEKMDMRKELFIASDQDQYKINSMTDRITPKKGIILVLIVCHIIRFLNKVLINPMAALWIRNCGLEANATDSGCTDLTQAFWI